MNVSLVFAVGKAQRIDSGRVEGIANPSAGNLSVKLSASKLSLTMKGDFAAYFPGSVYLVLWRGTAAQTAAGEYVRVQEQRIFPYETSNLVFTDGASDASLDSAERMYIFGNELENTTAPPCEVLFQHRDRAHPVAEGGGRENR